MAPRFVTQARLVRIRGQNVLFSASQHAIFTLNDTAAYIWRLLEQGKPTEGVERAGVDARDARGQVQAAIEDWQRLGLIRPRISPLDISAQDHVSQMLSVAGRRMRILYPIAHALPTMATFRHLEVGDGTPDTVFHLAEHGDRLHLFRNGEWLLASAPDQMATILKGEMLSDVLGAGHYELALHAAALLKNERLVLLCGEPGAGKTTLTMALAHAGFGFASDDVTLLNADGCCVGLPFAPAVKSGAWPLLAERFPDLDAAPIFRRPDNRRVRYLVPKAAASLTAQSWPVGAVILLHRDRAAKPSLEKVDPVDVLRGLLGGAFAPGGELGDTGFDVLAGVIGSVKAYRLTYTGLDEAVRLIGRACS
ncbi:PqqD family peptide modification chaperone [Ensifer sp. B1-9]|uniref:PqqD family protein n=1 Tax=Ensifer sp. B1-9 TaxID=3141455 RepID=UPI003D20CF52